MNANLKIKVNHEEHEGNEDFRQECGYAVVAGGHDEVQHFLRRGAGLE